MTPLVVYFWGKLPTPTHRLGQTQHNLSENSFLVRVFGHFLYFSVVLKQKTRGFPLAWPQSGPLLPPDESLSSCYRQGNSAPAPLRLSPFPCTANSVRPGTTSPFQTDTPKGTFAALAFLCRPVSAARPSLK